MIEQVSQNTSKTQTNAVNDVVLEHSNAVESFFHDSSSDSNLRLGFGPTRLRLTAVRLGSSCAILISVWYGMFSKRFLRATSVPAGTAKRVLATVILSVVRLSEVTRLTNTHIYCIWLGTESSSGEIETPGWCNAIELSSQISTT